MANALNWQRVQNERKMSYRPSQRSRAPSPAQITYLTALAKQKGCKLTLPKTMHKASEMIDYFLGLPDVSPKAPSPLQKIKLSLQQELIAELRERFPQLTPMTAHSMVQLFSQLDELGMVLTFETLDDDDMPEETDVLILYILRRFLEAFGDVIGDDRALAA